MMVVQVDNALEAVMNARAAGAAQDRLIYNPTPEVDSLVEEIHILHNIPADARRRLLHLVGQLARLNQVEATHERDCAGNLDEVLATQRATITSGQRAALPVKTIASLLRPALRTGGEPADIVVRGLLTRVPRSTLLGRGMRGELGAGPHAALLALVDQLEVTR